MEPKTVRIEPLNPLSDTEYENLRSGLKKIEGFRFVAKASVTMD